MVALHHYDFRLLPLLNTFLPIKLRVCWKTINLTDFINRMELLTGNQSLNYMTNKMCDNMQLSICNILVIFAPLGRVTGL